MGANIFVGSTAETLGEVLRNMAAVKQGRIDSAAACLLLDMSKCCERNPLELLARMRESGVRPDVVSYSTAIAAIAKAGCAKAVVRACVRA